MSESELYNSRPRIDATTSTVCDQIRGVASICVAAVHAVQVFILPYFGLGTPLHLLTSLLATYAVLAFFVVSGFMISISVSRHSSGGRFRWVSFLFARLTRIYPPLIAAVLVSLTVYLLIKGLGMHGSQSFRLGGELFLVREKVEMSWDTLVATLLLTYGMFPYSPPVISMDGPLWTLCYEFWFYMLAMFATNAASRKHGTGTLPFLIIVAMGIIGRNWLCLMLLIVWCSGFLLGKMYLRGKLGSARATRVMIGVAIAAVVAGMTVGRSDIFGLILEPYANKSSQFILAVVGILLAVALGLMIRLRLNIDVQWFRKSAGYSYTLYVVHFPLGVHPVSPDSSASLI